MKKLIGLFIFSALVIYSCKKSDENNEQVNNDAISAVTTARTLGEMKNSYALLNPSEKLAIWNLHFEAYANEKQLTAEQSKFISDFKNQWLKEDLFNKTSSLAFNFSSKIPQIKNEAVMLFGVDDTYSLLYDLDLLRRASQLQISIEDPSVGIGGDNDCHCSKSDSYCNRGDCRGQTGCKESNWGCGTLWWNGCDGLCKFL